VRRSGILLLLYQRLEQFFELEIDWLDGERVDVSEGIPQDEQPLALLSHLLLLYQQVLMLQIMILIWFLLLLFDLSEQLVAVGLAPGVLDLLVVLDGFLELLASLDKDLVLIGVLVLEVSCLGLEDVALGAAAQGHSVVGVEALEDLVGLVQLLVGVLELVEVHELEQPIQLEEVPLQQELRQLESKLHNDFVRFSILRKED